jgi:iron(III) transport system substrate-binding protein
VRKKGIIGLLTVVIGTSLLFGCGLVKKGATGDNKITIIPEKKHKEVIIASDIDGDYFQEYFDVFQSKYPEVKLKVETDSSKNILNKLKKEKEGTKIDLVFGYSAIYAAELEKAGLLLPYKSEEYDKINETLKHGEFSPTWSPVSAYTPVMAYNKNSLDKEKLPVPEKFSDLAKDIYDGYFAIPDIDKTPMGALIEAIVEKEVGKDKKEAVLKKLRSNSYATDVYNAKIAANLNEYKVPIAVVPDFEGLFAQWDDTNVKVVYGSKDTLIGDVETVALIKKGEINEDAKVFIDWFLSEQAMNLYKKNRSVVSRVGFNTTMENAPIDLIKNLKFMK